MQRSIDFFPINFSIKIVFYRAGYNEIHIIYLPTTKLDTKKSKAKSKKQTRVFMVSETIFQCH